MWDYSFMTLALLMWVPALVMWMVRPDLRGVMKRMALLSLPFAATERLFYPEYWSPPFVLDLVNRIGFGVEDILFVTALAVIASTLYAVMGGKHYRPVKAGGRRQRGEVVRRVALLLGACFGLVGLLVWWDVAMIYGACIIMAALGGVMVMGRLDLAWGSAVGALAMAGLYLGICWVLMGLHPGVFEEHWHTDEFLDRYVAGVPLEEVLYDGAAGFVATAFYHYCWGKRFSDSPVGDEVQGSKV